MTVATLAMAGSRGAAGAGAASKGASAAGASRGAGASAAKPKASGGGKIATAAELAGGAAPSRPSSSGSKTSSQASKGGGGKGIRISSGQQALMAEFLVCVLIMFLGAVLMDDRKHAGGHLARKGTGLCGIFLVLALLQSAGPKAGKVATSFGFIIVLAYLFNERDAIRRITDAVNKALAAEKKLGARASDAGKGAAEGAFEAVEGEGE